MIYDMKNKSIFAALFFILTLWTFSSAYGEETTVTLGVYTSDKPSVMYKKFKPVINYLQGRINADIPDTKLKLKVYHSYLDCIDAIVINTCDLARVGPSSYIQAKDRNKEIKLLVMEHKNGKKRFNGVFIAPINSPIKSINDLKGKSFAFGNVNSTIGRYLSQAELVEAGIYAADLKSFNYLGRHDKVALAVAAGNYDAGVVKENTFKKYAEARGLKKIGRFPNVTKPWIARAGLDEKLFAILRDALVALDNKTILKNLKQSGFLPATDDDYNFVREKMIISKKFDK